MTFTPPHSNSLYSRNENTYIPWVCCGVTHINTKYAKYAKDTPLVQLNSKDFIHNIMNGSYTMKINKE